MAGTQDQAIVFITGANQGLGYIAAKFLAQTGRYHVILGCRSPEKAAQAIKSLTTDESNPVPPSAVSSVAIELTKDETIERAFSEISRIHGRIDILINNAGVGIVGGTLRESYRGTFETNVFGTAAVTDTFLPLLRKSTFQDRRIVMVTSQLGVCNVANSDSEYNAQTYQVPNYRTSKAAVNMLAAFYANTLKVEPQTNKGQAPISVVCVCPGYCSTAFNANSGPKPAVDGGRCIFRAASEGKGIELNGTLVTDEGVPEGLW